MGALTPSPAAPAPAPGRRWSLQVIAGVAALGLVALGGGMAASRLMLGGGGASGGGTVLVLVTARRPAPAAGPSPSARLVVAALGLHPTARPWGQGWITAAAPGTTVHLSRATQAPRYATLFSLRVPAGLYNGAALVGPGGHAAGSARQRVLYRVRAGQLVPLLFTVALHRQGSGWRPSFTAAYAGNSSFNFGLRVAAGTVQRAPVTALVNAQGRPFSLADLRGRVVILASFLTECQETCPLVEAALLQVEQQLRRRGLANLVSIVEVTQDPADDTPAVLRLYAHRMGLPWTLATGSPRAVASFWSQLHVPPIQRQPWHGPAPLDPLTGRPEPFNLIHASMVAVIDPHGYLISQLLGQPTVRGGVPTTLYRYLDNQGRTQLAQGGQWSAATVLNTVLPLLQAQGVNNAFPQPATVLRPGAVVPPFTLPSTQGPPVSMLQLIGHPMLLDFWASWCVNCQRELPLLARTATADAGSGLRVVLINDQQSAATARAFLRRLQVPLPSLLDGSGRVAAQFGVSALPVNVFVDGTGHITAIEVGQLTPTVLQARLRAILPGSAG